jgi:hypothetical protein
MTRTIETDTTTSWALESLVDTTFDWLVTEQWEDLETEDLQRIEIEQTQKIRDREQDTTTSWTYL